MSRPYCTAIYLLFLSLPPLPRQLSSVIKVSSFGVLPRPPKGDDVIYVQPLTTQTQFAPELNYDMYLNNMCSTGMEEGQPLGSVPLLLLSWLYRVLWGLLSR